MSGEEIASPTHAPQAISAVEDALRALAKAQRAMQLYLPNNTTRAQAIEQARAAFARIWTHASTVELEIREASFAWDGVLVYQDIERGTDGLPWLLHRDGLRALTLHARFEVEELETLLNVFHRARTAAADEDDLVTLLWVADLQSVEYRHVELDGVTDFAMASGERAAERHVERHPDRLGGMSKRRGNENENAE